MGDKEFIKELLRSLESTYKTEKVDIVSFIKNHKHICYCEAIIDKDGKIAYVRPSHVETLIRETGKSRDEINNLMPLDAAPIKWLIDYTGCVSVWYDYFIIPTQGLTKEQEIALKQLSATDVVNFNFK